MDGLNWLSRKQRLSKMSLSESWGIIKHEHLGHPRSRRDLGLAAVVRFANDYSVPGLAGLSFLRSIVWSLIGIEFAAVQRAAGNQVNPSAMAEGLEALACWHSIDDEIGEGMAYRVRGARKLRRITSTKDLRLTDLARGQGYVSQPIRMGIGACLPRLGLVEAKTTRFNSFELNDRGREFLRLTLGRADTSKAIPKLWSWLGGASWKEKHGEEELKLISPVQPLPIELRQYFSGLMVTVGVEDERAMRSALWQACRKLLKNPTLDEDAMTAAISMQVAESDPAKAAQLDWAQDFFATYAAAFAVLDRVQAQLSDTNGGRAGVSRLLQSQTLQDRLNSLRSVARRFKTRRGPQSPPSELAPFIIEICAHDDDAALLRDLVRRDDIVLRLEDSTVSLHPDHKADSSPAGDGAPDDEPIEEPMRLYRLHNLCRLAREAIQSA